MQRARKASAERSTVVPFNLPERLSQMPCERQEMVSVRGNPFHMFWGDSPARNSWMAVTRVSRYLRWLLLSQWGTLRCPINVIIHTHTHTHTTYMETGKIVTFSSLFPFISTLIFDCYWRSEAWCAAIHGVAKSRHDWATELNWRSEKKKERRATWPTRSSA